MVGNHAQRFIFSIGTARQFSGGFQQRLEHINFIVGMNALHNGRNPLQPHTGIHRWFWQRYHFTVWLTVELHKYVIPDFDKTITVFFRSPGLSTPDVIAMVVENLGARTTGAGIAHLPEVIGCVLGTFVIANTDDAISRDAYLFIPDIEGFVVFGIHRHQQLLNRQIKPLLRRQKFPGVLDRIFFKVITKAEVTQHFKEGVMARGITDVFQIVVLTAGTHATL